MYFSKRVDRKLLKDLREAGHYVEVSKLLLRSIRYNLDRLAKYDAKDEDLEAQYQALIPFAHESNRPMQEEIKKWGIEMILILEMEVVRKMQGISMKRADNKT